MIISMFDKSLLQRRTGYLPTGEREKMEPVMQIRNRVACVSYIIPLDSAWKYNEPRTQADMMAAASGLYQIAEALHLGTDDHTLLKLQEYIEDGLDELVKMPPYKAPKGCVVGEYDVSIDGHRLSGDLTE